MRSWYIYTLLSILLTHSHIGSGIYPLILGIRHRIQGIITCSLILIWNRIVSSNVYRLHVCLLDIATMILLRHVESSLRCWSLMGLTLLYSMTRFGRKHLRNDIKSTLWQSLHLLPLNLIEMLHLTVNVTVAFFFLLHHLFDNLRSRLRLDNNLWRRGSWWRWSWWNGRSSSLCASLGFFRFAFTHVNWVTSEIAIPVMIAAVLWLVALHWEWVASAVPFMRRAAGSILAH